jgi:hypothetical protein
LEKCPNDPKAPNVRAILDQWESAAKGDPVLDQDLQSDASESPADKERRAQQLYDDALLLRYKHRRDAMLKLDQALQLLPEDHLLTGQLKKLKASLQGNAATPENLPETLSKDQVLGVIQKYAGPMKNCVQQQVLRDPAIPKEIKATLVIESSGRVRSVELLPEEELKNSYLNGCLGFIFKTMKFPAFTGEAITVSDLPLKLR